MWCQKWGQPLLIMFQLLTLRLICYSTAATLLPAATAFYLANRTFIIDWKILSVEGTSVYASIILDPIGLIFRFTVMFIAANVYLFALGYMADDGHQHRFGQLILLFVLSINFLIYSPNIVSLLLGWDGLGLTSFLLVIYYQNPYSVGAGLITALTNRIGDVAIIVGIAVMLTSGSWHLFRQQPMAPLAILVVLAAITKSAQFPFCSWLPMAIAAPTPVSALVHSSTLVTAGVFLLIRFYPVLSLSHAAPTMLLITGRITILLAGISASAEFDFKKIVAFSTLRQLGVMIFSLGLGIPNLAFFHLLTHAMFKALLFLCVGTAIHLHGHMQDLRIMGNLAPRVPAIQAGILLSNLALCGIPFLRGFYSKDLILEFGISAKIGWIIIILLTSATVLTSTYSIRRTVVTQTSSALRPSLTNIEVGFTHFTAPVVALSMMAVAWGASLNWLMIPTPTACLSQATGKLPLIMILAGTAFAFILLKKESPLSLPPFLQDAAANMWFLTTFSSQYIITQPIKLGFTLLSTVDQGWVEQTVRQSTNFSVQSTLRHFDGLGANAPTTLLLLTILIFLPLAVLFA